MIKQLGLVGYLRALSLITFFCAVNVQVFGQCGVYFKRAATWSFPVSKVYLDYAADMTGDGLPDLLVSEQGTAGLFTRARFFILPNLGNGNFGPPWATIEPQGTTIFNDYYSVVNVNNDGKPDLLIMLGSSSIPGSFRTYINNGNGTFTEGPTNSLGTTRLLPDINGDGFGDYLSQNSGGTQFRYNLGNGDGTFGPTVVVLNHGGVPTVGEFNGDGKPDFIDSNHLHLNNGDMTWGTTDISALMAGSAIWGISDFNVDGKQDILTSNTSGALGFGILTSNGTTFTRADHTITADPSWIGYPSIGNWGGNSAPDLVFQPRYVSKKVILTNDGSGNFTQQIYDGRIDITTGQRMVYADFDNDGKVDKMLATSYISNSRIMLRDVTSFSFIKQVCDQPGESRIVDYDRSNSTDWSFWNPANGDWSRRTLATQEGPPTAEETVNWGLESFGDIPTPGDFDGDGITDRAVYRNSTGYWYIRRSSDLVWFVFRFGLTGDKPVAADYDGDSITDIAVWRPSDGNWYVWRMGPQQFWAVHFGSDGDKPTPADYDGDLKTDVAVFRPSTGVWYYLKSSNNEFGVTVWGVATDKPIPADYDGDGKADIAVFRESNNFAYILKSTDQTPTYFGFGVAGDVIQVGDYDGDYVADLGVYRPSNRTWWTSAFPFGAAQTYGADGVIPTSSIFVDR